MTRGIGNGLSWGALVVLLALIPLFTDSQSLLTQFFLIFLYATLAQSWNILGGYAGQVNLGHAAFFGTGALVTRSLFLAGQPVWFSILAGGAAAAVVSLVVGVPAFRLKGVYFAIGTLALGEMLRIIVTNNFSSVSALPIEQVVAYSMVPRFYAGLAIAVATSLFLAGLIRSRLGLGMMAVREDESAARASGVGVLAHKLLGLAIATFFAGMAGGLYAYYQSSYYHFHAFSPVWTFEALLIVYIGGVGSITGPLLGAVFYVVARSYLATWFPEGHLYAFGALFILVVLTWSGGLIQAVSQLNRRRSSRS